MEKRLYIVCTLFLLMFIAVLIRLFFWQVATFDLLKGLSERQTMTSLAIPAHRGKIFASDGSPMVLNQRAFLVFAEPKKIKEIKETTGILSKELNIPLASVSAQLTNSSNTWLTIAHKIDEAQYEALKKYNLSGIGFIEESKRYYPEASMAAHILGFVGKNTKGEDQGYFGLEGYYDEQLRGRDGYIKQDEDARGNPILSGKREEIPVEDGRDLYLTIDKTVQYIAEIKLKEGIEKSGAKGGTVVILDPKSGGVLAMASFPSYNPVEFSKVSNELYKNPAVASSYEPGSTFKVLVMAAALNERKITPETEFNEEGPVEIGDYTIKTWNQKYHGKITISQILEYSSNVGMVFVGKQLGREALLRYIEDLGFGPATEVDLQEESSIPLRPKNKWYEIDYATASFGQGIAVTPLQMIRAVGAIANGGLLMQPYLVKSLHLKDGQVIDIKPKVEKRIFRKETTAVVTEMMVSAVENGETKFIKPIGFKIAGKTGTAQIPIAGHYDTEKTIASFVGFAPADAPKFVMLVTLREPTASVWGSETAAPVFYSIAKELFPYYKISPS